jgi:hypothetical protein
MSNYVVAYPTPEEFRTAGRKLAGAVVTGSLTDGPGLRNCAWVVSGYALAKVDGGSEGFGSGLEADDVDLNDATAADLLLESANVPDVDGFNAPNIPWAKLAIWAGKLAIKLLL